MRLKYIELFGFKTFPDKVRIPFASGINIIVGPNGCGKTNIVDAVKFILGEQNLKDLRLKNMNDIIFHGSNIRNQSSVALCRGVFENDNGSSFKYKDFSEIMAERRHFKNKETEYRINGITVPYREYLDFFGENGLSKHYSIIDSSKINAILNHKPNDLRLFFEEASGITKYKIQKKSASKKIESSANNLLRISDLYNETDSRLTLYKKASEKLAEYKALNEEKKRYDYALYDRNKRKIISEINKYKKEYDNYFIQLAEVGLKSNNILSLLTDAKTSFDKIDSEYKLASAEKNKALVDMAKLNSDIEYTGVRIKNSEYEITRKIKEIAEQNELKSRNSEKLLNLKNKLTSCDSDIENLKQKLNVLSMSSAEKKDSTLKAKNALDDLNDEILEIIEKIQNKTNKLLFIDKNLKNIYIKIGDIEKNISKISEEINETAVALAEKIKLSEELDAVVLTLKEKYSGEKYRLSEINEKLEEIRTIKDNLEKELIRIGIDISGLEGFIGNREGFSEGTKNFLNAKKDFEAYPLSDFVEIESGFENIVSESAAEILESVIINNIEDAEKALNYIYNNKTGEIKIFIPGKSKNKFTEPINLNIGVVPLKEKIGLNYEIAPLNDLGIDFYYYKDRAYIINYIKETGFFPEANIITEDGTMFFSNGFIIAGKSKRLESQNLFIIKKKLAGYKKTEIEKQNNFKDIENIFKSNQAEINKLNIAIDKLGEEIKNKEMERHAVKNDIKLLENMSLKSRDRLNILKRESLNLENDKNIDSEEAEKLKKEISSLETGLKLNSDEKTTIENKLRGFEEEFENAKEDETALKINLNSAGQNNNFLKKQVKDLEFNLLNYDKRIKSLTEQKERLEFEFESSQRDISFKIKNIAILDESLKNLDSVIKDKEINLEQLKKNIVDAEKDLESLNGQKLNIDKKKEALQAYVNINEEKLLELDLNGDLNGGQNGLPEEDENFLESIANMGNEDIKKSIGTLNEKIKELGDINMNAAKEYGEALERMNFLGKQKKDLESSINTLQGIIKKLDAASRDKFNLHLTLIRQKFKELFAFLFGGGHADILNVVQREHADIFEDPEAVDVVNLPGMEINVQIPGKKFSGINILSQGEKVLVAVSLLFSIFLIKKTPFCVIDEVDAPLDYANNARYNKLIEEISNYSQIILITHNKKTMEIGKNIFGVTSKRPGISGIVSVSMN